MDQKRVMILGANNFALPLIRRAKEDGYYTIVVSPVSSEPGFALADENVYVDIQDKESVLEAAQAHKISGIIFDQAETPVRTAAYVNEKLGLNGIGMDKAELFTNKYLMREKCREIGIDTIRYRLVNQKDEALAFYREIKDDVIMKPIDSAGSRGVVKVEKEDDIVKNFDYTKRASKSGHVIIEQYIDGKELLLDGVVFQGCYQNLICGEYTKCKVPGVFSEYMGKYPAEITQEQNDRVCAFVKRVIEGFGLPWGRTHTEVKINERGIWLMETAARGGGRYISSGIVPMMTDFDSCEFLLKACTSELKALPIIKQKKVSCGYVSMFLPKGKVISIKGLEDVLNLPYTFSHNCEDIEVGFETGEFHDKIEGRFIHLIAKDDKEFYERVENIKSMIHIEVQTAEGIQTPIWEG